MEKRFKSFEAAGHPVPPEVRHQLIHDARNGLGEWREGWPILRVYNGEKVTT
jgi:hypothetical protein